MPEFDLTTKLLSDVGSALVGSSFWSPNATKKGGGGLFQISGVTNSFNAQLEGTMFYDPITEVGSFWAAVGSLHTTPGWARLDSDSPFAAYRVDVNSCASGDLLNAAISF